MSSVASSRSFFFAAFFIFLLIALCARRSAVGGGQGGVCEAILDSVGEEPAVWPAGEEKFQNSMVMSVGAKPDIHRLSNEWLDTGVE